MANQSERSRFFKQTLETLRNAPKASQPCPLTKNLSIVTETDHQNNRCLCFLCTCSQHKCPSIRQPDPYPTSSFSSHYSKVFISKTPNKSLILPQSTNFPQFRSITPETTHNEHFQALSPQDKSPSPLPSISPPPKHRFEGRSNYNKSFLNWGQGGHYIVKQPKSRHTTDELRLNKKTEYQEMFVQMESEKVKSCRPKERIENKLWISGATTHRKDFVGYGNVARERGGRVEGSLAALRPAQNHFVTTNRNDFKEVFSEISVAAFKRIVEQESLL